MKIHLGCGNLYLKDYTNIDINSEKADLNLDYIGLFFNLLKVFLIPFFIAKVLKHVILTEYVEKLQSYYNIIIIFLLSFMIMISIAYEAHFLLANITLLIKPLAILFLVFIILRSSMFTAKTSKFLKFIF